MFSELKIAKDAAKDGGDLKLIIIKQIMRLMIRVIIIQ